MLYKWDIIGHERQLEKLEDDLAQGNVSHAYLFSGPQDVGKFQIATVFAHILRCTKGFCHSCGDCRQIKAGIHPDVIFMRDEGESLKIDAVRDLIYKTSLTSQGGRRVVLMENVERMPAEAQNALLKTLEEPPGDTVFLLTSTRADEVAATIKSRTRQIAFQGVGNVLLLQALTERFGNNADMEEILQMAQGRPGLAIQLLSDSAALQKHRQMYHQIDFFLSRNDLSAKFRFVEGLDEDPDKIPFFFDASFRYLRKLLHEYLEKEGVHALRDRFTLRDIADLFESLAETRYLMGRNVNKKLALENFFLKTER